jgi:hypothetical protein
MSRFSRSQVRVLSWSLGQYGCSCLGNAASITGRESDGGTAIAVGVDVVLCGKAGTNKPLPAASWRTPLPLNRACAVAYPRTSYSAPQLTILGTDLLHSLPHGVEILPMCDLDRITK